MNIKPKLKIAVLAAGTGSRMQNSLVHKALLPYKGKAIISHLIDSYPDAEFIIGVHHHADQLQQYISLAHPTAWCEFVDIDMDRHEINGPGATLLQLLEYIQDSCLVTVCDSIINIPKEVTFDHNWIGVAKVHPRDSHTYCNVMLREHDKRISEICEKESVDARYHVWTGTMYLKDWNTARVKLQTSVDTPATHWAGELNCSAAWPMEMVGVEHGWVDVGTKERYEAAIADEGFNYSKPDEITYVLKDSGRVIKFFADEKRVQKRRDRQKAELASCTPKELGYTKNFISYRYALGATFYEAGTPALFENFLVRINRSLWNGSALSEHSAFEFTPSAVQAFYKDKTRSRTEKYLASSKHDFSVVNGFTITETWLTLLDKIDFAKLCADSRPVNFHGDLQFDNIIVDHGLSSSTFSQYTLIDWRDQFISQYHGDIYYELGKLLSGITFSFDLVKKNIFNVVPDGNSVGIVLPQRPIDATYDDILWKFCRLNGYDWERVKIFRWLIIASMCGVHHEPYATALYYYSLAQILQEECLTKFLIDK